MSFFNFSIISFLFFSSSTFRWLISSLCSSSMDGNKCEKSHYLLWHHNDGENHLPLIWSVNNWIWCFEKEILDSSSLDCSFNWWISLFFTSRSFFFLNSTSSASNSASFSSQAFSISFILDFIKIDSFNCGSWSSIDSTISSSINAFLCIVLIKRRGSILLLDDTRLEALGAVSVTVFRDEDGEKTTFGTFAFRDGLTGEVGCNECPVAPTPSWLPFPCLRNGELKWSAAVLPLSGPWKHGDGEVDDVEVDE